MTETRTVKKSLLSMEDVSQGVGSEVQTRGGAEVTVHKVDVFYGVNSEAEMKALDVTRWNRASVYSDVTTFVRYIFDPAALAGIAPDVGVGFWVELITADPQVAQNTLDIAQNTLDIANLPVSKVSNKPTNTAPVDTAIDVSLTPTLTTSAYSGTDVLVQVRFAVYSNLAGTVEVWSVINSGDDVSIIVPAGVLSEFTQYWWGARHIGVSSISDESDLTSFTTENKINLQFNITQTTGNGGVQQIITPIDATGGNKVFVWGKSLVALNSHALFTTERGAGEYVQSDTTGVEVLNIQSLSSFNVNGFTLGTANNVNTNLEPYAFWSWLAAIGLIDIVEYIGDGINGRTVAHNAGTFGAVLFRNLDLAENWTVQHRSIGGTKYLRLNDVALGEITDPAQFNNVAATDTTLTLGTSNGVNRLNDRYEAIVFAHNNSKVFCDEYNGSGVAGNKTVTGFPVGWLLLKSRTGANSFIVYDVLRGTINYLTLDANFGEGVLDFGTFDSDGFTVNATHALVNALGTTYICIAIRDPNQ